VTSLLSSPSPLLLTLHRRTKALPSLPPLPVPKAVFTTSSLLKERLPFLAPTSLEAPKVEKGQKGKEKTSTSEM
jgi:hypothetical protein